MTKLVTFGCSYTFGHGLEDCVGHPDDLLPSKFAWPAILGKKLGLEVDNRGYSGASNKYILDEILRYNFTPTDIICVLWSFRARELFYTEESVNNRENVGPWHEQWVRTAKLHDTTVKSTVAMHHGYYYLKSLPNKFYMIDAQPVPSIDKQFPYLNIPLIECNFREKASHAPKAADNRHPGNEFHIWFANRWYEEIIKDL